MAGFGGVPGIPDAELLTRRLAAGGNGAQGDERRTEGREATEPGIDECADRSKHADGRVKHGSPDRGDGKPGPLCKRAQLSRGAELRCFPCGRAEPGAQPPDRGPETPAAELADHYASAGSKDARHFADEEGRILGETQHRDGRDHVERSVRER